MERYPVPPKRRHRVEVGIRILDIVAYLIVFGSGVSAMWFTPQSVTNELYGWEWLIPWWSTFLLVGGLVGFIGRLSTIWVLEPAAAVAASVGVFMYMIVLGSSALTSSTSVVALCLVSVAQIFIIRRYFELQLFGSDPAHNDFKSRLADTLTRRTIHTM